MIINTPFMPVTHLFTYGHLCMPVFTGSYSQVNTSVDA